MSDAPTLRPYQSELIDKLRHSYRTQHKAPLMQGATGMGKTVVFCNVLDGARQRGNAALVVVHRRELVEQASNKLAQYNIPHGIIAAGLHRDHEAPIQVASIQTLTAGNWIGGGKLPRFKLIVFDEAHHARAASWEKLLADQPDAWRLGVTATPARLDGKGLGQCAGGPFDDLILGPSTAELIDGGYLSPVTCFVPPTRIDRHDFAMRGGDFAQDSAATMMSANLQLTGDILAHYRKHADHKPAIAFCPTVAYAEKIAALFANAGYRSACVHGSTPKDQRHASIYGLADGTIEVLTSCQLIDEGVDVPLVSAIILLRPTKSLVLHRQQIGRGMRPADGKERLVVIDHVGNIKHLGGPLDEPEWSLEGVDQDDDKAGEAVPIWICPDCDAVNPASARFCSTCGVIREVAASPGEVVVEDADLVEYGAPKHHSAVFQSAVTMPNRRAQDLVRSGVFTRNQIYDLAEARGYKPGWAWHLCQELREQGKLRF